LRAAEAFNIEGYDATDKKALALTQIVARYASDPARSRGRRTAEEESAFRSCFQRDRDRIIHSSAFRRLKHKTQVFVEHEGDYYRTRLTHSIEVAQVARTIAGALGLNQELTEAVALAHDLGHTPFGHTGEDALDALMAPYGGFDHNAQALRIVTTLERHYAEYDGLNLTWDTLEGIAKHNGPVEQPWPLALAEYNATHDLELSSHASAEAQVAALSDDVAYNNHDLHDGLRAGLFNEADICALPIVGPAFAEVDARYPGIAPKRRRHEALRRVFGVMVSDVIDTSRARLDALDPVDADAVRAAGHQVVCFSEGLRADLAEIRAFLFSRMYRAPEVMAVRAEVTGVVQALFGAYMADPTLLPAQWQAEAGLAEQASRARRVADYIAGMTDRYALQSHDRLFGARAAPHHKAS
jgi:dGTPase